MCLINASLYLIGVGPRLRLLGAARDGNAAARYVACVTLVAVAAIGAAYEVHQARLTQCGAFGIAAGTARQICLVAGTVARHCVIINLI